MSGRNTSSPVCCPACQHVFKIGLAERFWAKVDKDGANGCWNWLGCTSSSYGAIAMDGRNHGAHRVAYLLAGGTIPEGYHVDHLCRNRLCVNPQHLEAVTPEENLRRAHPVATHCKRGHERTPENTYTHPKRGYRHCRKCQVAAQLRYMARKKTAA